MVISWIRFVIGFALLICGLSIFAIEVYGIFRFKYVLNRMHAAAMGDTLGIGFSMLGLIVLRGISVDSLKMVLIILFLWCASPVSSHLIAFLEAKTNRNLETVCRAVIPLEEIEEEIEEEAAEKAAADGAQQAAENAEKGEA